ncbi:MAG TPA: FAD-dependent oxidoreductase [Gemmatimonadaceae bacterium]|nr:FAD-dependent oxidoreductase [Gemmatimonadaceae bacterium]
MHTFISSAMHTPHVLVIGGGFAGVAAAATLRAGGMSVTLLDDRRTLGGRARSDDLGGIMVDTGAQFAALSFVRAMRLLGPAPTTSAPAATPRADAIPAALHPTPGRDRVLYDGDAYSVQYGSVRSLLGFGALGPVEKMKLGASLLPLLGRYRWELDASAERLSASLDRESARAFMSSRVGEHSADLLVEPLLNGFYAMHGSEASMAFFLTLGRYGMDSTLLAPHAGWSAVLVAALRGAAHVGEARVITLEHAEDGSLCARAADGREWHGDAAVIATGPRTARMLLGSLCTVADPLLAWLDGVEMRQSWTLALLLDTPLAREAFGVFQDARVARDVSACGIYGTKLGRAAPLDRDVLLAWPTPDATQRLAGQPSQAITSAMMPEIERMVPAVVGHITHARLYRFDEGTPVARPGFAADRARGRALADALEAPVALAGDYLATPLIEGAIASGERAAATLRARLARG